MHVFQCAAGVIVSKRRNLWMWARFSMVSTNRSGRDATAGMLWQCSIHVHSVL
jgi:hypothetical protein